MHLASSGIDVWSVQLHGAVLRYVRLTLLAQSLSLEVSLGRDLQAVQKQIQRRQALLSYRRYARFRFKLITSTHWEHSYPVVCGSDPPSPRRSVGHQ